MYNNTGIIYMFIKYGDSQERILKEETRKLALNTFLLSTSFYDKKFRGE
jgi:hypothetical protein